jgi:hypothetical protein
MTVPKHRYNPMNAFDFDPDCSTKKTTSSGLEKIDSSFSIKSAIDFT